MTTLATLDRKSVLRAMIYPSAYLMGIVSVNWAFSVLPMFDVFGVKLPAATAVVGLTFILRDMAQRAVGHYVILYMLAAVGLSYLLADPAVVLASVAAFTVSEITDWVVYTIKGGSLRSRILVSSAASAPMDSAVFLALLPFPGAFTWTAVAVMTAAKLVPAFIWWLCLPRDV